MSKAQAAEAAKKAKKARREAKRNDPKLVFAARELRDRYLEQFNRTALPAPTGKYDVAVLPTTRGGAMQDIIDQPRKMLPAA